MLNEKIKKKSIKNDLKRWPELTFQTHDLDHKIEITSWKTNQKILQIPISVNSMVKNEIKK